VPLAHINASSGSCSAYRFSKTLLRPKIESNLSPIFTCRSNGTSFDGHYENVAVSSRFPTVIIGGGSQNVPSELGIEKCNHWHHSE
jgi:hypothetical protein